jgi:hypothetical protein
MNSEQRKYEWIQTSALLTLWQLTTRLKYDTCTADEATIGTNTYYTPHWAHTGHLWISLSTLLYDSQGPVATVGFPSSSRYCRLPKFQSLLYDSQVPVASVWFPSSSRYCRLPKMQSLLYDSHLNVRPLSAFRIILRTKAKFRSPVQDPVVVTGNIFCALLTELLAAQIRGSTANIRRLVQRLKGTFPVMTESQCWS